MHFASCFVLRVVTHAPTQFLRDVTVAFAREIFIWWFHLQWKKSQAKTNDDGEHHIFYSA